MKKIALILTGAFLSVSTIGAFANTNDNVVVENFDGKKSKVEQAELPQEVIQSLEESEYQNWEIQEAYKVENDLTNEVHYELHLASDMDAEKVKSVTFNQSGEILSEDESDFGRTEDSEIFQDQDNMEQGTEPNLDGTESETETETVPSEQY